MAEGDAHSVVLSADGQTNRSFTNNTGNDIFITSITTNAQDTKILSVGNGGVGPPLGQPYSSSTNENTARYSVSDGTIPVGDGESFGIYFGYTSGVAVISYIEVSKDCKIVHGSIPSNTNQTFADIGIPDGWIVRYIGYGGGYTVTPQVYDGSSWMPFMPENDQGEPVRHKVTDASQWRLRNDVDDSVGKYVIAAHEP